MSAKLRYFEDLASDLLERMEAQAAPASRAGDAMGDLAPMPAQAELAELMRVAYWASLLEEEGRHTEFTVAYVSPEGAERDRGVALRFAKPIDLAPKAIAKLAPSTDPARTSIGVAPREGQLAIWGLVEHGDRSFAVDRAIEPLCLRIVGAQPGILSVAYRAKTLLSYARGQYLVDLDGVGIPDALQKIVTGVAAGDLQRLARRMLQLGHGGAILVVDPAIEPRRLSRHPHTTFDPANRVLREAHAREAAFFERGESHEKGETHAEFARRRSDALRAHRDALDHVARLTAVDGAVLMRWDLTVDGYGATIDFDEHEPIAIDWVDPRVSREPRAARLADLGGTRHRSAACFCAAQEAAARAIAIVASQDGELSLFGQTAPGRVLVIKPLVP